MASARWCSVFDSFDAYPTHSPHFGSLAGVRANRIGGRAFEVDGKTYTCRNKRGPNSLHGGPGSGRLWERGVDDAHEQRWCSLTRPMAPLAIRGRSELKATHRLAGNRPAELGAHHRCADAAEPCSASVFQPSAPAPTFSTTASRSKPAPIPMSAPT